MCEPTFEGGDVTFRTGWLRVLMVLGLVMLVSGLFWLRLDLVVEGEGVVEARDTARLYALREARVAEVRVEAGEAVEAGAVLLVLEDAALAEAVAETGLERVGRELEVRLSELAVRELELLGGTLELDVAAEALRLQREQLATLEEVRAIYRSLAETGSVSRLDELDLDAQVLNARRESLLNERRAAVRDAGMVGVWLDRERARRAGAEAALAVLEGRERVLAAEMEGLKVRAPFAGRVTQVFVRDAGARVEAGALLAAVVNPGGGYEAKIYVGDRNVDLVRVGSPVRLETPVYSATAEGYMRGRVTGVVTDADSAPEAGFEVRVALEEWPVEPVIGSRVTGEIFVQRQGIAGLLLRNPAREAGGKAGEEALKQEAADAGP